MSADETRDHVEVCPVAGQTVQEIARRIKQHGGFGLFVDYGHTGEKGDTFRVGKFHLFCSLGDNSLFWAPFGGKFVGHYFFAQKQSLKGAVSLVIKIIIIKPRILFIYTRYFLFRWDFFLPI